MATFVALTVIVILGWHDIVSAFHKMLMLNLWVLLLILPAQFLLFFSVAKVYYFTFKTMGQNVPMKTLLPASIELNFVNHIFPSGGVSGFSYLNMRLKHDDISPARSTLAQITRFVCAFATFIVWLIIALVFLAAANKANGFMILITTALTCLIIFSMSIIIYVIGSRNRIKIFAGSLTKIINRIVYVFRKDKPAIINITSVEQSFNELHEDYLLIRSDLKNMKRTLIWAFIASGADFGALYVTFLAHGAWVNLGAVILAFAVASTAGLIAVLPGGLGVYEPLMAAVLLSAGIPADLAVSATLVYRVTGLLLALGSGYVLYHIALNRHAGHDT